MWQAQGKRSLGAREAGFDQEVMNMVATLGPGSGGWVRGFDVVMHPAMDVRDSMLLRTGIPQHIVSASHRKRITHLIGGALELYWGRQRTAF